MTHCNGVNLVVAHALEAKPLIECFRLSRQLAAKPYPIYGSEEGICLIVSGMGRQAAMAATVHLGEWQAQQMGLVAGWLNVGIAGHQKLAIGAGILAHKIIERESSNCFYPSQMFSGFATGDVISVDTPELNYPENAAYEMEASGFYASAMGLVSAELAQVYKIISDNPFNSVANIDASFVTDCLSGQIDQIQRLVSGLQELAGAYNNAYKPPAVLVQLESKLNPSVTQRLQLKRLVQRYHALKCSDKLNNILEKSFNSARQLIAELELNLRRSKGQ
ncbi:MAG TPA: hypothetical protein EYO00_03080 [Gammaproteobacteria bacterium]|nr:hypothetical protein [Gammaproteobacteria bacterium]